MEGGTRTEAVLNFVVSSPGKVILSGEHSVVHGTHALATVIDKRTYASFSLHPAHKDANQPEHTAYVSVDIEHEQASFKLQWKLADLQASIDRYFQRHSRELENTNHLTHPYHRITQKIVNDMEELFNEVEHGHLPAARVFLLYYTLINQGRRTLSCSVRSELPIGAGLGSSGSYCSVLSTGFLLMHRYTMHTANFQSASVPSPLASSSISSSSSPSSPSSSSPSPSPFPSPSRLSLSLPFLSEASSCVCEASIVSFSSPSALNPPKPNSSRSSLSTVGTGSDRRTNIPIVESSDGNTRNINDNNKNNNGYNNNVHHNHDIDHDYDHDDNDGDNNTRNYNNNNNNHTNNRTNNDAKKSHSNRSSNKQSQSLHGTAEADIIGIELEHPVLSIHNSNTTNITNAEAMLAVKRLQREKPCPSCLRAINAWAYEGERLIHGTPSGVDNSCSVFGGAILYRKGRQGGARRETKKKNKKKGAATMGDHGSGHERNDRGDTCDSNDDNGETKNNGTRDYSSENDNTDEDGSSFALVIGEEGPPRAGRGENKLIPYTLPNSIRLIITDTQQPRNTKRLVASVHRLYDQLPSVIGPIFESMDGLVLALLGKVCEAPGGGDDPSGYSSMKRNDEAGSDHDNNMLNINPININDNNCNDDGCENNDRGNARGGRKYETDGNRVDKSKPNTNTMSRSGKDADEREKNSIEQGKGNKTETDKAREKENEKDYIFADIGSLFTLNQHLLNSLGVGHSRIDEVVGVATSHGLHSKLTGAGGGGCVISLVPPLFSDAQYALFEQSVNAMNMRCFQTVIGQQGTLVYPQVASIEHVR